MYRFLNVTIINIGDLKSVIKVQRKIVSIAQAVLGIVENLLSLSDLKDIYQPNILRLKLRCIIVIKPVTVGKVHLFSELCFPKIIFTAIHNGDFGGVLSGSPYSKAESPAIPGIAIFRFRLMENCLFNHLLTSKFH